jgi:hypothetical protein
MLWLGPCLISDRGRLKPSGAKRTDALSGGLTGSSRSRRSLHEVLYSYQR